MNPVFAIAFFPILSPPRRLGLQSLLGERAYVPHPFSHSLKLVKPQGEADPPGAEECRHFRKNKIIF
jgi:hypothetical protein